MFRRGIPLEKTEVTLKTYSGETMTPEGIINVPIQYNHQTKVIPLFVVNTDWKVVKSITKNLKKDTQKKLKKLLDEYSEIFQEEIGTLKSTKAKLPLKEGYQAKFCKARPVPYALKPKVDAELKRLESEGILEKVTFSDWASPIVPVVKPNGEVRICGDFKVTVNPQIETEQ